MKESFTYADAGVDIDKANKLVDTIGEDCKTDCTRRCHRAISVDLAAFFRLILQIWKDRFWSARPMGLGPSLRSH